MLWSASEFFSFWALIFPVGLLFAKNRLLNLGSYGAIIVLAMVLVFKSIVPLILLALPLLCFLLNHLIDDKRKKKAEQGSK